MKENKIKKISKKIGIFFLIVFAIIGFFFTAVFFGMKFNLTNVKGSIDSRNEYFRKIENELKNKKVKSDIYQSAKEELLGQNFLKGTDMPWQSSYEWQVLKEGLIKDKENILRASSVAGVSPRLITSVVISEQFRFFTSSRESFKKFFEPLKILGIYTQFSYGITGIKEDTAQAIENHLRNQYSPFYLGKDMENVLEFTNNQDKNSERLNRLTDKHNHYYSYLYTALFLKQIITQWQNSGFAISDRPEVLATIFNIGFGRSVPKENPEVGGSTISINGTDYTFGGLAYEFYHSGELEDIFPY